MPTGVMVSPSYSLARRVVGGPAVVADDAQHGLAVGLVARERPDLGGDLGRRGVGRRRA